MVQATLLRKGAKEENYHRTEAQQMVEMQAWEALKTMNFWFQRTQSSIENRIKSINYKVEIVYTGK